MMQSQPQDQQESELPTNMGRPARRALAAAGYVRLAQFSEVRAADLLRLHGVGLKGIERLRHALHENGIYFADEQPKT